GVIDIKPENVKYKGRLEPGKMLLIDTEQKKILTDDEIKEKVAGEHSYKEWNYKHIVSMEELQATVAGAAAGAAAASANTDFMKEDLLTYQKAFGYTYEDITKMILPMAAD